MKRSNRRHKNISDYLTYAYIKKIRKWMFCPACQNSKMTIDKKSTMWTCEDCGYQLSTDEFEDDYVFWFCDECNDYLNNQEGFDRHAFKHICRKCGYENETTFTNIKGICSDCGKIVPDQDATLCEGCKKIRKQKLKERLLVTAAVVGTVALAMKATKEDENTAYLPSQDVDIDKWLSSATDQELEDGYEERRQQWIKDGFGGDGEKTSEMKKIDHEISRRTAIKWENDPRRNKDPNFRWTDANRWDND